MNCAVAYSELLAQQPRVTSDFSFSLPGGPGGQRRCGSGDSELYRVVLQFSRPCHALLPGDILGADKNLEKATDLCRDRRVATRVPMDDQRGVQETREMPLHDLTLSTLKVTAATTTGQVRLLVGTDASAVAWLNALPSSQLGTHLSNESSEDEERGG